jgi:hypothetical protein
MKRFAMGAAVCALVFLVPVFAAEKPSPTAAAKPAAESGKVIRNAWPPETLSGKIMTVVPGKKLVIVQDAAGVPFDMRVTGATRIEAGKQPVKLDSLEADRGKQVSVRFIPERSGDIAQSIQVAG